MGKFDGILLCTDIDGTLLNNEHTVSGENKHAVEYFKSEGGLFTFATGRIPTGIKPILEQVTPNAPVVCHNGSAIYDFKKQEFRWRLNLDENVHEVVEYVMDSIPFAGVEVVRDDTVYFCRMNETAEEHRMLENFPLIEADFREVAYPWTKILFVQTPDELPKVKAFLRSSHFTGRYRFIQSSPKYYEVVHKDSSKGYAMRELARELGIPLVNTVAVGDNENDYEMVGEAGLGIAVANAVDKVKKAAKLITADNNSSAIARVIEEIEAGRLAIR